MVGYIQGDGDMYKIKILLVLLSVAIFSFVSKSDANANGIATVCDVDSKEICEFNIEKNEFLNCGKDLEAYDFNSVFKY